MTNKRVTRDSDGKTIDLVQEEAEHADLTANAHRVILTDSDGTPFSSANPLNVDTELTIDGGDINNLDIKDISAGTQTNDVKITMDGEEVTVNATDLDIRDLTSASDDVSVTTVKPDGTNTLPSGDVTARPIYSKLTDGTTDSVITTNNELKTLPSMMNLEIARENISGFTFIHKFGEAPDFDTGDDFVDVWDGASDGAEVDQNLYQYSSSADIDFITSSNNGDTQDIEVQGLDTNYALVTQTITLTGQTPSALSTQLIRIFRMKNVGSTSLVGNCYCYVSGNTVTAGVPQTDADVRAIISLHGSISHNQTLMALYTIPSGKTGYLCKFYASAIGGVKTAINETHIEVRPFGQVFQTKHTGALVGTGTSHFAHSYDIPEVIPAKADIRIQVDTDVSSSGVSAGFDLILVDN